MRSRETPDSPASNGVARRDVVRGLAVAAGAIGGDALLPQQAAAAATSPTSASEPAGEVHEAIEKVSSFEKTARGGIFHCMTSGGKTVDVNVTVCTPQIIQLRMCPDPKLKDVKSLLDIKEDWAASPFKITESEKDIVIDTGAVRFRVQRDPWQYSMHDSRKEPVMRQSVEDWDVIGDYRSLRPGFTATRTANFIAQTRIFIWRRASIFMAWARVSIGWTRREKVMTAG
jgi:hypothetical protein